jgi:hypothetical protein
MIFDVLSGARLNFPDDKYRGTETVRLFLSEGDARMVIERTKNAGSPKIRNAVLVAVPVPPLETIRGIAAKCNSGENIGYVIHGPNEVYNFS